MCLYWHKRVQSIFKRCKETKTHQYLESRGVTGALLRSKHFIGRIFVDSYQNAVFPHYNDAGVCGLELKNPEKAMFVRGSQKTFWRSNCKQGDNTLIIGEAVIDALSHNILFPNETAIYAATGGGMSLEQGELLKSFVINCKQIKNIVIITDNDAGGDRLHDTILSALNECSYNGTIKRHSPKTQEQDWNNVLIEK